MKIKFFLPNGEVKILDNTSSRILKAVPQTWKAEVVDKTKEMLLQISKNQIPLEFRCQPSSYMAAFEQPFSNCEITEDHRHYNKSSENEPPVPEVQDYEMAEAKIMGY